MSLTFTRQIDEARACLCQLAESETGNTDYCRWAYNGLSHLSLSTGKPREALAFASRGLSYCPNDGPLLYSQANAFFTLEDYNAAADTLEQLISGPEQRTSQFSTPAHLRKKLAPRMLGSVRRWQGKLAEAESILYDVLRDFPTDAKAWYILGLIYLDLRRPEALQSIVTNLLKIPGGCSDAGVLAALWHLRQGNPSFAGPIIDDLIAMEPEAPPPRMLRAEWLSTMNATLDEQIRALRDIVRIQPGNVEALRWIERVTQAKLAASHPAVAACPIPDAMMPLAAIG